MDNTPLYNSRIIKSYVEYLKRYLPDIDIDPLLKYADIETYQLDDEGHWLTQRQVDRFHDMLAKMTHDPNISRKVGRFSVTSRASGALGHYMLGFINPATAYSVLEKINARLSRGAVLKTQAIGAYKIEAKAILQPGTVEKPYQCHNRLGGLEALAKLSTNKFASIEHPVCIHEGGDCCLYIISWEKTRTFLWKRIRNYSFIIGFAICAISLGFIQPAYWDVLVLFYVLSAMGVTLYAEHLEKNDLLANTNNQGDAAERLLDQINRRYNEALLIQEIGQAASMILEVDKLLEYIMESLVNRLDLDRGMIMLANKQKDCLVYAVSYGYNPKDEVYMKNIKFHLDNPHSRGTAVEAFRKQMPILVNDLSEIENDLSKKSLDFVRTMGSQSFLCVPIVYKGESLGILAVDNVQSKKPLSQTEMSLLMGIAPQIGMSIQNAISYQKIKESEERYRSIYENAIEGIYQSTPEGRFISVNPAMSRMCRYETPEEMVASIGDIATQYYVNPQDRNRFKSLFDEHGSIDNIEFQAWCKDGNTIWVSTSARAVRNEQGQLLYYEGRSQDITERKRSENERKELEERLQRSEKMEALGTLAGGVAHDLNNVLGALVGYSELLAAKLPEGSPMRRYADNIFQSGIRGAAIIQDLLTLARRGVTVSEVVDLNRVVFDYLKTPEFENLKFHHPQVKYLTELEEGLLNIKGSPVHLGKAVMNLVSNATESISSKGEVTIGTENLYLDHPIRGYDEMLEGDYAVLKVADTGTGISADDLGKIFEPFYTKKVMGRSGTGLGLAVVWGTIKDHNGYIDVQSEEGKGSTFILYFPVTRETQVKVEKTTSPDAYMSKGESILVVDDVMEQREVAISMLESLGYQVKAMASGELAIKYLKNNKADLIVLDMIMDPGIDGMETYQRILEINPGQKAIIASGFSETDRVRKVQEMGAGAFVRKPYILEKIGFAVRKELDRK